MEKHRITYTLLSLASIVVIIAGLKAAQQIVVQFLLALFFAILFLPIFRFFVSHRIPKTIALSIVLLINLSFVYALALTIMSSVKELKGNLDLYQDRLTHYLVEGFKVIKKLGLPIPENLYLQILDPNLIFQFLSNSLISFGNILANAVFVIILVVFILLESDIFAQKLKIISQGKEKTQYLIDEFLDSVIRYMKIKGVASVSTGLLAWGFLYALGVDFALLWGILAFLLNFIPTVGSIIAAIPPILITLIDKGVGYALAVAVWYLIINMVIGNILEPKFLGKGVRLSPFIVLVSLVFWGWVLGTVGMFLSIPLTVIAKIAFELREETRWIAILMDSDVSDWIQKEEKRDSGEKA
ncbi:MAG: AI-2E family transporter [Aquificae bacterium]|nr:AI-2E family transporter [Aquificota bacterium]